MQDLHTLIEEHQQAFTELTKLKELSYHYNPRTLIYSQDKIKLYHYHPIENKAATEPVLVIFATVNRPEILDLFPEKSFIRGLLNQGLDVYMLDWGYPDAADKAISFNDYVNFYLKKAVTTICTLNQCEKINLVGICQGGLISLCYTSITKNIKKLVLISTPIDFHSENNLISQYVNRLTLDEFADNVRGDWLTQFFISLRPFELVGKKYLNFSRNLKDDNFKKTFMQVEKWLHDAPDQPQVAFSQFIKWFYQENNLIKDKITLGKKKVLLKNVNVPILNIVASKDEIIPPSSSKALKQYVADNLYHELEFSSGHIGIYISEKVGNAMPKQIAEWLTAI